MHIKSQSALEVLTLYSFLFVIIIIALAAMYLLITAPSVLLRYSQCGFYAGFSCPDSGYSLNWTGGGSTVYLLVLDEQPGITNITSFESSIQGVDGGWNENGFSGSCKPSVLTQGELSYCTAMFDFTPKVGYTYRGLFEVDGHYCPPALVKTNVSACPSQDAVSYRGFMDAVATSVLPTFVPTTIPTTIIPTITTTIVTFVTTNCANVHVPPNGFGITGGGCRNYLVSVSTNGIYVNYQSACPTRVDVASNAIYYDNVTGCNPSVNLGSGSRYYNIVNSTANAIIPLSCGDVNMGSNSLGITGGACTNYRVNMGAYGIYVNYQMACPSNVHMGNHAVYYNNVTGCDPSVNLGKGAVYHNINNP